MYELRGTVDMPKAIRLFCDVPVHHIFPTKSCVTMYRMGATLLPTLDFGLLLLYELIVVLYFREIHF